jgi:hypothetical protein
MFSFMLFFGLLFYWQQSSLQVRFSMFTVALSNFGRILRLLRDIPAPQRVPILMAAHLEELVRLVTYTFYDNKYLMVLTALLETGKQIMVDEFSTQLKLRNRDLSAVLSRLKQDDLVAVGSRPNYSDVEERQNGGPGSNHSRATELHARNFDLS